MQWFVYIIKSEIDGDYYKGITQNIDKRLDEHNEGKSKFTSTKMPWKLVFCRKYDLKRNALIEEKRLKKLNRRSLDNLIQTINNRILSKFTCHALLYHFFILSLEQICQYAISRF